MASDVMTLLIKQMDDEKSTLVAMLADGGVGTMEKYREACGRIYGLSIAQRIVGDMKVRLTHEDE